MAQSGDGQRSSMIGSLRKCGQIITMTSKNLDTYDDIPGNEKKAVKIKEFYRASEHCEFL